MMRSDSRSPRAGIASFVKWDSVLVTSARSVRLCSSPNPMTRASAGMIAVERRAQVGVAPDRRGRRRGRAAGTGAGTAASARRGAASRGGGPGRAGTSLWLHAHAAPRSSAAGPHPSTIARYVPPHGAERQRAAYYPVVPGLRR